jgi:hypothetical protein
LILRVLGRHVNEAGTDGNCDLRAGAMHPASAILPLRRAGQRWKAPGVSREVTCPFRRRQAFPARKEPTGHE